LRCRSRRRSRGQPRARRHDRFHGRRSLLHSDLLPAVHRAERRRLLHAGARRDLRRPDGRRLAAQQRRAHRPDHPARWDRRGRPRSPQQVQGRQPGDVHHLRLPDGTPMGPQPRRLRGRVLLRLLRHQWHVDEPEEHWPVPRRPRGMDTFEPDERAAQPTRSAGSRSGSPSLPAATPAGSRSTTSGSTRACAPRLVRARRRTTPNR
jgi:hypothetical protein